MFSLVIAIIAIALVAVLAAASVYYGSDAFQGNQSKARYAEIVNQSEMISNAFLAFKINGNDLDSTTCNTGSSEGCLQQLVDAEYLSAIPDRNENGRIWNVDGDGALFTTTQDPEACVLANESKGYLIGSYTGGASGSTDANGDGVPDAGQDTNTNGIHDAVESGAVCIEQ